MQERTVLNVPSIAQPRGLSMLPALGALQDTPPKRSLKKRKLNVSTRKRDLLGQPRDSPPGSPITCIRREFNLCSRECRVQVSHHESECLVGMQARFGAATARIRGIGRLWRSWSMFGTLGWYISFFWQPPMRQTNCCYLWKPFGSGCMLIAFPH